VFFRHSACRVWDPEKADFFFVPAYLTCWELQRLSSVSGEEKARVLLSMREKVQALPYRKRKEGFDHIFLFGASAWQLPRWRDLFADSVILAVESRPIMSNGSPKMEETVCWHCEDCFQPWKDLVVPPVTPLPGARALMTNSKAFAERRLLMTWHGQHSESENPSVRQAYTITNETVRIALMRNLGKLPDVSIGSPVSDYAGVMGNSKFCLCPKGASSYTSRVFEALFAGCVPVLLSDDVRLPFDDVVDWAGFSIRSYGAGGHASLRVSAAFRTRAA